MTGSRTRSGRRPAALRPVIGAMLVLGLLTVVAVATGGTTAQAQVEVIVNSTANTATGPDGWGDCDTSPDSGFCTLREAINFVNDGQADTIKFHAPVFSEASPGLIDLSDGDGQLPIITQNGVTIDAKGRGVVLDCEGGDCDYGIAVQASNHGFDFDLNGGGNTFVIQNIDGDGLYITPSSLGPGAVAGGELPLPGKPTAYGMVIGGVPLEQNSNHALPGAAGLPMFSLGDVRIDGVDIHDIGGFPSAGLGIVGLNLDNVQVTNSEIESDHIGVVIGAAPNILGDAHDDNNVLVSGNRIVGGLAEDGTWGEGVQIEFLGDLASTIDASVSDNEVISGYGDGVQMRYEGEAIESAINFTVDNNDEINSRVDNGVAISIWADGAVVSSSDDVEVNVSVSGNGDIESESEDGGDAVEVDVWICCAESDSIATVAVDGNGRLTGGGDGVEVSTDVCCGDGNAADVSVSQNDEITGEGDDGVEITALAGYVLDHRDDSDGNAVTVTVDGNNEIDGLGGLGGATGVGEGAPVDESVGHGVEVCAFAGPATPKDIGKGQLCEEIVGRPQSGAGFDGEAAQPAPNPSGDGNASTVNVINNSDIDGDMDGIHVDSNAGSSTGEADENVAEVTVSGNGEVTGDDGDGVNIGAGAGSLLEVGSEGDDNSTSVVIENNAEIGGNGGDGIEIDSFAGGDTDGSERSANEVVITQNGDIEGQGDEDDGIDIDTEVCCDAANTNTITINANKGEITGHDDDGIDIEPYHSVNVVTIMDNEGIIRGGDDNGIEYNSTVLDDLEEPPDELSELDGLSSLNILTIVNNNVSDSEDDGINICCGAFELEDVGKSVIANNIITGNGDDGIDIESSFGLNIGPANVIANNGTETEDNGVEIDSNAARLLWEGTDDDPGDPLCETFGICDQVLPGNHNTITQNMIYDNAGLGINLLGVDEDEGLGAPCGCDPWGKAQVDPNDCIDYPVIATQSGDKLVGTACSECLVEIFWADNDPANQTNPDTGNAHGEGAEFIVSGMADVDGNFSIDLPCGLAAGDLTATGTDKIKNTSEFSANKPTLGTGACAPPTATPAPPTATPEPTDTPEPVEPTDTPEPVEPTDTPEPAKACGDVDDGGSVTSVDASLILQLKAGLIDSLTNPDSADVNGDGEITSVDAALILQLDAGLIEADDLDC